MSCSFPMTFSLLGTEHNRSGSSAGLAVTGHLVLHQNLAPCQGYIAYDAAWTTQSSNTLWPSILPFHLPWEQYGVCWLLERGLVGRLLCPSCADTATDKASSCELPSITHVGVHLDSMRNVSLRAQAEPLFFLTKPCSFPHKIIPLIPRGSCL